MAMEIERKYLVTGDRWRDQVKHSQRMRQAYLSVDPQRCIRVRVAGQHAHINLKSSADGIHRHEYQYPIPVEDALAIMQKMCRGHLIDKTRHEIPGDGVLWEVDEFHGDNQGLIVAEVELSDAAQHFDKPDWLGREVSDDPRVYNMNLSLNPFSEW